MYKIKKYFDLTAIATYNHFSHQVELNKFGESLKDDIESSLYITPSSNMSKKEFRTLMDVHSLLWHEYTHFLDHSTTIWGLEYNIRTMKLYQAIKDNSEIEYRYEIFCLNLAEIKLHDKIKKYQHPTSELTVGYRLEHDQELGIYALYSLYDKASASKQNGIDIAIPKCEVPLSMLAVIEANAYAQELLFKYSTIMLYNKNVKKELRKLEVEFERYIADCDTSEYSIMIRHALQVFPKLQFIKVLEIVSKVSRFVMNAPMALFGIIQHDYIYHVFRKTPILTNILIHDFARGSSRASLFLIFIQLLAGHHAESTNFDVEHELDILIDTITGDLYTFDFIERMYKDELNIAHKLLQAIPYTSPLKAIGLHNIKNAEMIKNFEFDFTKLLLPAFTLKDLTLINMPKSLHFDYDIYLESIYDEYSSLDDLIETGRYSKKPNIAELGGNIFEGIKNSIK